MSNLSTNPKTHSLQDQNSIFLQPFNDCLNDIQEMWEYRFIEKISRPLNQLEKMNCYEEFKIKYDSLHQKLKAIENEYYPLNNPTISKSTEKQKSLNKRSSTHSIETLNNNSKAEKYKVKNKQQKQKVAQKIIEKTKQVEFAYRQMFINGSFKYYVKIAVVRGLPLRLPVIAIDQWSQNVTFGAQKEENCCGNMFAKLCCV